ncbi:MAG: hypothetical protein R3B54_11175 [Bdellovibrionota bacterium]
MHGYPIHGLWIETQHIRFSPAEVLNLVALENAAGFHTLVRTPSHARTDIQGYLDTGAGGLIIPVTDDPNQIREAFAHTFYSAWREAGFSPDLGNLQAMAPEQLDRVDHSKVLAFMVESVAAVIALRSWSQRLLNSVTSTRFPIPHRFLDGPLRSAPE